MNREQIQQRIDQINADMVITRANYSRLEGHLSEATHWMAQVEKTDETLIVVTEPQEDIIPHEQE